MQVKEGMQLYSTDLQHMLKIVESTEVMKKIRLMTGIRFLTKYLLVIKIAGVHTRSYWWPHLQIVA